MFESDDFIAGLAIGTLIDGDDAVPKWRWIDFVVYGVAGIVALVVVSGIAWLICR